MPHTFQPREEEPEPEAGGSRLGGPPRKHTAAGVLDPPVPPRKPLSPIPGIPRPIFRILTMAILIGIAAAIILYFYFKFR
jgi:hypothetical protein